MKNTQRLSRVLEGAILPVQSLSARPLAHSGVWKLTSVLIGFVATVVLLSYQSGFAQVDSNQAQSELPMIQITVGGVPMTVEVAATNQQRYMGLSFRQSLPEHHGMLFAYREERPLTFTMRNTLIPLSIAFVSKDLIINEIHLMNVGPGQLFHSQQEAQYALEVNQGWFKEQGIKPGDIIKMP